MICVCSYKILGFQGIPLFYLVINYIIIIFCWDDLLCTNTVKGYIATFFPALLVEEDLSGPSVHYVSHERGLV